MRVDLQSAVLNFDPTKEHLTKINSLGPLKPLSESDVFVRAMKLTGNQLNSQGGRFFDEDMPKLAAMSVGAPVLIGHLKSSKPIASLSGKSKTILYCTHP